MRDWENRIEVYRGGLPTNWEYFIPFILRGTHLSMTHLISSSSSLLPLPPSRWHPRHAGQRLGGTAAPSSDSPTRRWLPLPHTLACPMWLLSLSATQRDCGSAACMLMAETAVTLPILWPRDVSDMMKGKGDWEKIVADPLHLSDWGEALRDQEKSIGKRELRKGIQWSRFFSPHSPIWQVLEKEDLFSQSNGDTSFS
jgi:hypothetical protein